MGFYLSHFSQEATPILLSMHITTIGPAGTVIPRNVLTFPKPRLRHLHLSDCRVPWGAVSEVDGRLPFSNLSSLCLTRPIPRPSPHLLMRILISSLDLSFLDLYHSIPDHLGQLDATVYPAVRPASRPLTLSEITSG
ncbi:hypothetical protein BDV98DRAFT_570781 [Pterulicium gracile]|uniref:F-box domain-containing protein n=1 Tax=Pterulicium gracile TaxID=1884261 RepID=A0A5C3QCG0_9AGAR|nr:hypothetical protein BDV98DRAFT_570781 [Pterula gracilis]